LTATLITSTAFPNARRPIGTNAAYEKDSARPPDSSINMLPKHRVDAEGGSTSGVGPEAKSSEPVGTSAFGGKADSFCSS